VEGVAERQFRAKEDGRVLQEHSFARVMKKAEAPLIWFAISRTLVYYLNQS
jgi:hypothetical protein